MSDETSDAGVTTLPEPAQTTKSAPVLDLLGECGFDVSGFLKGVKEKANTFQFGENVLSQVQAYLNAEVVRGIANRLAAESAGLVSHTPPVRETKVDQVKKDMEANPDFHAS